MTRVALSGVVGVSKDVGAAAGVLVVTPHTDDVRVRLVVSVFRWDPAPGITTGGRDTLAVARFIRSTDTFIVTNFLSVPICLFFLCFIIVDVT